MFSNCRSEGKAEGATKEEGKGDQDLQRRCELTRGGVVHFAPYLPVLPATLIPYTCENQGA